MTSDGLTVGGARHKPCLLERKVKVTEPRDSRVVAPGVYLASDIISGGTSCQGWPGLVAMRP